jgi:hypothetical protein
MPRAYPVVTMVAAGLAASVLTARGAWAEPERVLVVAEGTGSVLVRTLTSELAAGGYEVQIVGATVAVDLSSEAAARHARTVLRVSPTNTSIDLWIADHEGSEVQFRERIEAGPAKEDPSLLAIRAQEAVHGKLLPVAPLLPQEPPSPAVKPVPTTAPPPLTPTAPPRFSAAVGPSVVGSPGGASPMGDAALAFSWLASEHWMVEAMARLPVLAGHVDGAEGVAHVGLAAAGGGLSFAFAGREAALRPSAGVGVALGWTHIDGIADAPFVSHSANLLAALPYACLSTRLRLTSALSLRAQVLGGPSLPPQAVTFAGRQAATFGEPVLDGTLMLEATWH